ncbi:MAG TPA: hypothetical protein VMT61_16375 [Candidatus Binataceae bacterium]|nr:hypothetical protein [Candidatus Binataceae bacterium]
MRSSEKSSIALILAISMLITGLPIVALGSPTSSRPAFTVDICTPAQVTNHSSIQSATPLIPTHAVAFAPIFSVQADFMVAAFEARFSDPPTPPPPKSLV